jgi:hypothetical protein
MELEMELFSLHVTFTLDLGTRSANKDDQRDSQSEILKMREPNCAA